MNTPFTVTGKPLDISAIEQSRSVGGLSHGKFAGVGPEPNRVGRDLKNVTDCRRAEKFRFDHSSWNHDQGGVQSDFSGNRQAEWSCGGVQVESGWSFAGVAEISASKGARMKQWQVCIVCGERFLRIAPDMPKGQLTDRTCHQCRVADESELLRRNRLAPWCVNDAADRA